MSILEALTGNEHNPEVYRDLLDQINFALDDAFTSIHAHQGSRGIAEFVQRDTHSLRDSELIRVLLSESGGKPDVGAEKIKLLARPIQAGRSVAELADLMREPNPEDPVYDRGEYFIAHQHQDGEWRFSRVDEKGIYPWVPYLKDVLMGEQAIEDEDFALTDISILETIRESDIHQRRVETRQLLQLDEAYAKELIAKISMWPIVPQN